MKIIFVATVDIHIINFHLSIINKLRRIGNIVDVAANGNFNNNDINKKYNICFSKNPFSFDNIKAYFQIKKVIQQGQYDIISCHTPLSSFFTRIACRRFKNIKVIYTAHGFHFFKGSPLINRVVYKSMERIAARYTDILVTINQEDYNASLNFKMKAQGTHKYIPGVGIDKKKIKDAKNNKHKLVKELGINENDYVILSVGELNANKNHILVLEGLLDKFRENKQLKYFICGIGEKSEDYPKFIRENELENQIYLLGYRNDVYDIYHIADLFVFPSRREGLPVSLMEAMASGVISVATDVRGNRDLIDNEINGFIIKDNSKEDLHSTFEKILDLKDDQLKQIRGNAEKSMLCYEKSIIEKQILELYK